jgi:hypothetical protein
MLTEPIDQLHRECITARDAIRLDVHRIRTQINAWQPQPCPPPPTPTETRNRK